MFRSEPEADFRIVEATRPDPRHPGISFLEHRYFLATGNGGPEVELSRSFGEAIAAGQGSRPQPMGRVAERYWWLYRDDVYSTPDRLSRAAVLRLAEREQIAVPRSAPRQRPRLTRGDHATA